ncbi:hypothetical protein OEA41_000446 [Lepraria neglecta]|uniref:Uncharacterized protein n=1 Tax=Lepraria neglecta TaxID=209136 RepID=A0AAD9ZIC7_9LECA|nr:hypothetical protein OEA41_000446 [Lepraria neglecta]
MQSTEEAAWVPVKGTDEEGKEYIEAEEIEAEEYIKSLKYGIEFVGHTQMKDVSTGASII